MGKIKNIDQKVVLITGASSGIGEALAFKFAKAKARLLLIARREDRLKTIREALSRFGVEVVYQVADVTQEDALKKAVQNGIDHFGKIDIVIANAGYGVAGPLDSLTLSDYYRQFEVNVFGVLRTLINTFDQLKKNQGTLALIGSVAGHVALPGGSPYCMSKFAIRALAESLVYELKPMGISVVHVSPGFIETDIRKIDNHGVLQAHHSDPIPQWLRMPVEKAASQIFHAICSGKHETIITAHGKVAVFLQRHFSWIIDFFKYFGLRSRRQPH